MPAPTERPGAPCWIDLFTSDPAGATAFYGGLLGWTALPPDPRFGGYFVFALRDEVVAGCMRNDGSGGPDTWSVYLASDDAARTAADASAHGGTVHVPPMRVEENGVMAMVADPGGAAIGVWEAGQIRGFERIAEPGAAAWFELHTRAYDGAVDFYRDVFAWDAHVMADTPEFRYTTLGAGDDARAGIMDGTGHMDDTEPAAWAVYFAVEDTDAAIARAVELGGAVITPAHDTPYGRLAVLADTTGTRFRLIGAG